MARMARESECDAGPVGAVAQLGERLVRNEEVSGSIPLSSTNKINHMRHGYSPSTCLAVSFHGNCLIACFRK